MTDAKELTIAYEDGYTSCIEDVNDEIEIVVKRTDFNSLESLQGAMNHLILFGYHKLMEQLRKEEENPPQVLIFFTLPE